MHRDTATMDVVRDMHQKQARQRASDLRSRIDRLRVRITTAIGRNWDVVQAVRAVRNER